MSEIIASSVLQWIDNKGEKFFQEIKQSEFDLFQCAVDGSETGMAGLPINCGKRYHLTAKTRQQMEKRGFTYMGVANINDIPTSPKIASSVLQIEFFFKNKKEYKVIKPPKQLDLFKTVVTPIISKLIDGKRYSLVAKKPWQMEKLGFKFAGVADLKEIPRLK